MASSGRNETVDLSSSSSGKTGGGHASAFLGMAIVGIILVAMLILQANAGSPL